MTSRLRRIIVATLLVVVLFVPVQFAMAGWVYWTYSNPYGGVDIYNYKWYHYSTIRSTTYSPYGIWFRKDDGPSMSIRWRGTSCGSTPQYAWGEIQYVSNSDPAPGVYLKDNSSWPYYLQFCLSAIGNGNNPLDQWTGRMNWDG